MAISINTLDIKAVNIDGETLNIWRYDGAIYFNGERLSDERSLIMEIIEAVEDALLLEESVKLVSLGNKVERIDLTGIEAGSINWL